MNEDQNRRVRGIFEAAVDLPVSDREGFLQKASGGDGEILAYLRELLAADAEEDHPAHQLGNLHVSEEPNIDPTASLVGRQVGQYVVKALIGTGGMGSVYEAIQESTQRSVALKVIRPGIAVLEGLRRFKREVRILGRLHHPGIAQIHEAGTLALNGEETPFFSMEYIRGGRSIIEYAAERKLDLRSRLALFEKVCEAVHHGHEEGVTHRDLKPANILVGADEQPKIIDYGVARATDCDLAATRQTATGLLVGTLPYMSPEQCAGDPTRLDHRTDVYSLGVVLYELLSGKLPYEVSNIFNAPRVIREEPPTRLSAHDRSFRGDLEIIVGKALAKEPERRYQAAGELGEDLQRFLNHQPIRARPPSLAYQVKTFCRRNVAVAASVAVIFVVLAASALVSYDFAIKAFRERNVAQDARADALLATANDLMDANDVANARKHLGQVEQGRRGWEWHHMEARLDQSLGTVETRGGMLAVALPQGDGHRVWLAIGDKTGGVHLTERSFLSHESKLERTLGDWKAPAELADEVTLLTLSSKSRKLALVLRSGHGFILRVLSLGGFQTVCTFGPMEGVTSIAFNPDDSLLAAGCDEETSLKAQKDGAIRLWDTEKGSLSAVLRGHTSLVRSVAFDRAGMRLVSTSYDKTARLWDVPESLRKKNGVCRAVFRGHTNYVLSAAVRPDGNQLATGCIDGSIKLWDIQASEDGFHENAEDSTGVETATLTGHRGGVSALAFDDNGSRLVSGSIDTTLRFWEAQEEPRVAHLRGPEQRPPLQRAVAVQRGHTAAVWYLAFDPSGGHLVSQSLNPLGSRGEVKLWASCPVEDVPALLGHTSSVKCVAFSPDGTLVASGSGDKTVRIWDADTCQGLVRLEHADQVRAVVFSPIGETMASGSHDGTIKLWTWDRRDESGGGMRFRMVQCIQVGRRVLSLAFSSNGTSLAAGMEDPSAAVWRNEAGVWRPVQTAGTPVGKNPQRDFQPVAFLKGSRFLVTAGDEGGLQGNLPGRFVRILEVDTTRELWRCLPALKAEVTQIAVWEKGETARIAGALRDGTVPVWDAGNPDDVCGPTVCAGHAGEVWSLAFHPDGQRLASGATDHTIKLWHLPSGTATLSLRGHLGEVAGLAFGKGPFRPRDASRNDAGPSDAVRLASASYGYEGTDNSVKLWETDVVPETRERRANAAEAERTVFRELRPLLGADAIPASLVGGCFDRITASLDEVAVRMLQFRDGTSRVAAVVRAFAREPGLAPAVYQRARSWVVSLLSRDQSDPGETRDLEKLEAELSR